MMDQLEKDLQIARSRNLNPNCHYCGAIKHEKVEMKLEPENYWYKCPSCGRVQAIHSNVPLWWIACPKQEETGYCNFPLLVTKDMHGNKVNCKKCSFEYTISIGG